MRESGCAVVRQGHLIALVGTFLIGCAVLLIVFGCSGRGSESPQEQDHGRTEATRRSKYASPKQPRPKKPDARGRGPSRRWDTFTTNDLPGCPKGGLLLGTDKADKLDGKKGDDEIRGLGAADFIFGGVGNDDIYAGPGDDASLFGDEAMTSSMEGNGDDGVEEGKGRGCHLRDGVD